MALRLTQRELAQRAFCSINTIKKIEGDQRRPSRELATTLAEALSLPPALHALFAECARGARPVALLAARLDGAPAVVVDDGFGRTLPPLLGRTDQLRLVITLLARAPVVTIVGQGGSGKTRLALAAAEHIRAAGRRVVFVPLAGVTGAPHLAPAVAQALGLELSARYTPEAQLLDALRSRSLLLVLDNYEQLLPHTALVARIAADAPGVTLLVTSRERLGVPAEQLLPLGGLPYSAHPDDPAFLLTPAAQLFLHHAQRTQPRYAADPAALWQLCRLTDGLPLALELAATWVDTLPLASLVDEIARNLDMLMRPDGAGPPRHSSLRGVFDATWERLGSAEKSALARLAVCVGGFTREAAAAVAAADLPLLAALNRHHLITHDPRADRYHMHELLRQYALEQLDRQHGRAAAAAAHYAYCRTLAQRFAERLHSAEQHPWLQRLEQEDDNLRAALAWALAHGTPQDAAALALDLAWYWRLTSRIVAGRAWLEQTLAVQPASGDPAIAAALHFAIGHKLWMQGEYAMARDQQQRSAALWQSLGAGGARGLGYALHSLGMIADQQGDHAAACDLLQESVGLFRQVDDRWGVAFAQQWLGASLYNLGELSAGRANLETSLATMRRLGDQWAQGLDLVWLAQLALAQHDPAQAAALAHEAGTLLLAFGHRHGYGAALGVLARAALAQGETAQARRHLAAAAALYDGIGNARLAEESRRELAALG